MSIAEDLQNIQGRWEVFAAKVEERMTATLSEAGPGLDEIIATEVLDPAPLAGALSELRARMLGLVKKVDDAFEKLDGELDAIADSSDGSESERASGVRDELVRRRSALAAEIKQRFEALSVRKAADGARALGALAQAEMDRAAEGTRCATCGGPIKPTVLTEPCNVVCGHCKAVNTVRPGAATILFYQGTALHSLAAAAALTQRKP